MISARTVGLRGDEGRILPEAENKDEEYFRWQDKEW
jgi:hypothetical protein